LAFLLDVTIISVSLKSLTNLATPPPQILALLWLFYYKCHAGSLWENLLWLCPPTSPLHHLRLIFLYHVKQMRLLLWVFSLDLETATLRSVSPLRKDRNL
jgi:hypothetical protein